MEPYRKWQMSYVIDLHKNLMEVERNTELPDLMPYFRKRHGINLFTSKNLMEVQKISSS